ncbi:MFS transporter [Paracidovorax cattleyae]|uniref:MFS transporter n=1 Tax=Paracidovorax cattleyae TaxID=80868 RepID=UPI0018AFB24B|nr:MFS transporter [Paracidovorax cattleyae]MBF9265075.1 MHS family MFS transporter [Paracidovorax cattleyae]
MAHPPASSPQGRHQSKKAAASGWIGSALEYYDFFIYATAAALIFPQIFFPKGDPAIAIIASLATYGVGYVARPIGAFVLGHVGDTHGRKQVLVWCMFLMGFSTIAVGLLPTYDQIGLWAPALLVLMRLIQGFAVAGEISGASSMILEHAPFGRRGFFASFTLQGVQAGQILAAAVFLPLAHYMPAEQFNSWGWRIPFLVSILLLGVSLWIRLSLSESPAFQRMKAEGKTSKAPLAESFGQWKNLKIVILALIGLTAGQAVVWYTGQFYALFFLTQQLKVDAVTANLMIAAALLIGTPFFVVFGALSDRIGRKPIIMLGCVLAVLTYFPVFKALTEAANPDLAAAQAKNKVVIVADPAECSFQFNPTGTAKFTSSCDVAKQVLAASSVSYDNEAAPAGTPAVIRIGQTTIPSYTARGLPADEAKAKDAAFKKSVAETLKADGYPSKADPAKMNKVMMVVILTYLVLLVTMVYGPIAAMLVEMFPTRIRYTSMSLPYHIGNGWFGGLLPTMSFAIVAQTGNMYNGLWYPIIIAGITAIIGTLFIRETKDVDIYAGD